MHFQIYAYFLSVSFNWYSLDLAERIILLIQNGGAMLLNVVLCICRIQDPMNIHL